MIEPCKKCGNTQYCNPVCPVCFDRIGVLCNECVFADDQGAETPILYICRNPKLANAAKLNRRSFLGFPFGYGCLWGKRKTPGSTT